jgi:hypothetical protein
METALTVLVIGLALLPGWAVWLRMVGPSQPSQEVAISGLAFALGLAMLTLHLCAYASLTLFAVGWTLAALAGAYWLYRQRPRFSIERALVLLALAAAAIRFAPVLLQDFPHGWDPYFHLLIVRLIGQSGGHVASLSPFEDIPINYPIGSHLLVALIAKCSGASIYGVYQALLALFGTLSCLQVHAWVRAATGNRRWALYAMAAYAFLAVQGSIGYYEWGGLPNLIGMYLLAGCLTIVAQRDAGERRWWALPPMYLAIALSNHHVLIVAFMVLLALVVWLALQREARGDARRLLAGGLLAALVGVPYLLHHFLSTSGAIFGTGLLTYGEAENTMRFIVFSCGVAFSCAVVGGAAVYARNPRGRPLHAALWLPAAVMLMLFVLFEHLGLHLMLAYFQRSISPFTPSRFITDAVYPLSAFAGLAFLAVEERIGRSVLPVVLLLFLTNAAHYKLHFLPAIDADRLAAYRWVEANTRPDAVVFDTWVHAPVLTNRVSSYTALPSSEQSANASKRLLLDRIQSREVKIESTGLAAVLLHYTALPPLTLPSAVLWRSGEVSIVDVNPQVSARAR